MKKILIILAILGYLGLGCKEKQKIVQTKTDSVVTVKIVHDSIYMSQQDSVYVFQSPDSVYKEVWRVRWRDREKLKVDTIYVERIRIDTIIQKEVVGNQKPTKGGRFTAFVVGLIVMLILLLALWLYGRRR